MPEFAGQCPRFLQVPNAPGWLGDARYLECRLRQGHAGAHKSPFLSVVELERDEMNPDSVLFVGPGEAAVEWGSDDDA